MEVKIALKKFLEKNSSVSTIVVKMLRGLWPLGVMMVYAKLQTVGASTCLDDIASSSGCPFCEGCCMAGYLSIKNSMEKCKGWGRSERPQGLLSVFEKPLINPFISHEKSAGQKALEVAKLLDRSMVKFLFPARGIASSGSEVARVI